MPKLVSTKDWVFLGFSPKLYRTWTKVHSVKVVKFLVNKLNFLCIAWLIVEFTSFRKEWIYFNWTIFDIFTILSKTFCTWKKSFKYLEKWAHKGHAVRNQLFYFPKICSFLDFDLIAKWTVYWALKKFFFFKLSYLKVIRKSILKLYKSFRWHLGDYQKHIFFLFEGLWEEKLWFLCVLTDV